MIGELMRDIQKWWGATLRVPASVKSIRQSNRALHKWRYCVQAIGDVGFTGGIFQGRDTFGKPSIHIHLLLATDAPEERLKELSEIWERITKLPQKALVLEPIYNLDRWLRYVYLKNAEEAEDWRLVYYKEQLLKPTGIFTTINAMKELKHDEK
jgi:hypothetical protein